MLRSVMRKKLIRAFLPLASSAVVYWQSLERDCLADSIQEGSLDKGLCGFGRFLKVNVQSLYIDRTRAAIAMCMCTHTERSHAQNNTKFREENFRDHKSNHEIHENIVPRKFRAIRYAID